MATCCFPPSLPLIFIIKFYNRHEELIKNVVRKVLIIGIAIGIIYAISGFVDIGQFFENGLNDIKVNIEQMINKVTLFEESYLD